MIKDITIENYLPHISESDVYNEIMLGLMAEQKYIQPKYFYDTVGSELFEEITHLDEYYPTRTEKKILSSILDVLPIDLENLCIIELGSGDPSKITLLFNQIPETILSTIKYYPVDICESEIIKSVELLSAHFPLQHICGIVADFNHQLHLIPKDGCRLFCFFGSTLGNFTIRQTELFLTNLSEEMQPGDHLILGVDMVKDIQLMERAYNDAQGVTSRFNLNVLNVINRIMKSEFCCDDFEHLAFFNPVYNRIEMHLRANRNLAVKVGNRIIHFRKGETIHTENSHKFDMESIQQLCKWGKFTRHAVCHDRKKWFGVIHGIK